MQTLFSPDSKIMQALSRIFDLALLNCLYLLTCIPVVTAGAAATALYSVCFAMDTEQEAGLVRPYFRAFRANFRQSTVAWLVYVVFLGAGILDLLILSRQEGIYRYALYPVTALLALGILAWGYLPPLLSRFENSLIRTVKNALLMSVAYLPRSLAIGALNLLPWALLLLATDLFVRILPLWLFLYFAAAAYLNTRLLDKVFAPFLNREEPEEKNP